MSYSDLIICNQALSRIGAAQITALTDKADIGLADTYANLRDELLTSYDWKFAIKRVRATALGLLNCSAKTIAFNNANPDTITDSGSGFVTGGFVAGDRVNISGSTSNDGIYGITTVAAGTLTLDSFEALIAESKVNSTTLKLYAMPADKWSYKYAKPSGCLSIKGINQYEVDSMLEDVFDIEDDYIVTNEIDNNSQITIQYIQQITDPTKFNPLFARVLTLQVAAFFAVAIANDKSLKESLLGEANNALLNGMTRQEGSLFYKREDSSWVQR